MRPVAFVLLVCFSLAACGDDGSDEPGGGATSGATSQPAEVETERSEVAVPTLEATGVEVQKITGEFPDPTDIVRVGDLLYVAGPEFTVEVDLSTGTVARTLEVGGYDIATDGTTLWGSTVDLTTDVVITMSVDLRSGEVTTGPRLPVAGNPIGPELAGGFLWWSEFASSTLLRQKPGAETFAEVSGVGTEFRDLQGDGERLWMIADEGLFVAEARTSPKVLTTVEPDPSVNDVKVGGSEVLTPGSTTLGRFDAVTGEPLGTVTAPFPLPDGAVGPAGLWVASIQYTEGSIVQLDPETGEVLASVDGVFPTSQLEVGEEAAYAMVAEGDSDIFSLLVLTPTS